MNLVKGTGS